MPDTARPSNQASRTSRLRRMLAAAGTACMLGTTTMALQVPAAHAAGTAYYVDCSAQANGDGSSASPWNTLSSVNSHTFGAGDQILLRAGTSCTGYLQASGSGTSGAPITVDRYGTGTAPTINNNGTFFANEPTPNIKYAESAAVVLQNVSYWTVQNIAVTNNAPTTNLGGNSGVLVDATDNNTYSGITIQSVDVTNVNGAKNGSDYARYSSAGILVQTPDAGYYLASHFNGVSIKNNTVHDVNCMGIAVDGGDQGHIVSQQNTGVHIEGNTVTRPADDAILVGASSSPLVEHNVALYTGWNNPNSGAIAAMWAYDSYSPTFQYNEADYTQPSGDSNAWDCDWMVTGTCTYQYNYSNSNAGGFFMNCLHCVGGVSGVTMVVRDNISQNEAQIVKDNDKSDTGNTLLMYNNTFDSPNQTLTMGTPDTAAVTNNIFIGKGVTIYPPAAHTPPDPINVTFNNNLWWGFSAPSSDTHAITKDPLLIKDSAGGLGTGTTAGATMGDTNGFQLRAGSPALNSGVLISDNNSGINGGKDFWGNPVSATAAPNIGAFNGNWTAFNDNDINTPNHFTYTGTWDHLPGRGFGDYQDDVHYTRTDNDNVTFTFTGTGVNILTETNSDEGTVNCSLDGGAQKSYNASATTRTAQVSVLTLTGLTSQQHTLTLTKASGSFMVIDRADVLETYNDDGTSALAYTGTWKHLPGRGFGDFQDDVDYTMTDNDSVTFTFTGTSVKAVTETNSDEGTVTYSLDGGAQQGSYNASSTTRQTQVPVLVLPGLANTQHTLTLTKTNGTYMVIDRFDVSG